MLVKDQIRVRMDQLGVTVKEMADRCEVSDQSVRHWLAGRNYPKKAQVTLLENALSFKLDFSEGSTVRSVTVEDTLRQTDVETLLAVAKLSPRLKLLFSELAKEIVALEERYAVPASPAPTAQPVRQAPPPRSRGGPPPRKTR